MKENRTLVVGDIHGAEKALVQVLDDCGYDKNHDKLIFLGDYVDGWDESFELIELLISIRNNAKYKPIFLMGNHDYWFFGWLNFGQHPDNWVQGGYTTLKSYIDNIQSSVDKDLRMEKKMGGWITNLNSYDLPKSHIDFFNNLIYKYLDEENRAFVHAGFINSLQDPISVLIWDRSLWRKIALPSINSQNQPKVLKQYKEIYIGHTSTMMWRIDKPMNAWNVYNIDTGAGWSGKLTIMDIDTKQYWQSESVQALYPNSKGRRT